MRRINNNPLENMETCLLTSNITRRGKRLMYLALSSLVADIDIASLVDVCFCDKAREIAFAEYRRGVLLYIDCQLKEVSMPWLVYLSRSMLGAPTVAAYIFWRLTLLTVGTYRIGMRRKNKTCVYCGWRRCCGRQEGSFGGRKPNLGLSQ